MRRPSSVLQMNISQYSESDITMPTTPIRLHSPMSRGSPRSEQSLWSSPSESSLNHRRERKRRHYYNYGPFTYGQALLMATIAASFSAILTATVATYSISNTVAYPDIRYLGPQEELASLTRRIQQEFQPSHLRRNPLQYLLHDLALQQKKHDEEKDAQSAGPSVTWLMSYPNSGTSFTLHMTREASNSTTATNYAWEGEIRDQPSVQAIPGLAGEHGPWLELIPNRETTIPTKTILTKTHCNGFCTGCRERGTIQTVRSFMVGCASGFQARLDPETGELARFKVSYDPKLVKKAIRIFRHPLDNIVARFHLEYNVRTAKGDVEFGKKYPKNHDGFHRWCAKEDMNKFLLKSSFVDEPLKKALAKIPCYNEFYRYVQWHNLAFSVTHELQLETMILHYHEYSTDFERARDRVLNFLELPRVGEGIDFQSGKVYRHYYSPEQKRDIRAFLQEFASLETWEQLKDYDFEFDKSSVASET